jgi:peptidyl-tRNA hydrolase
VKLKCFRSFSTTIYINPQLESVGLLLCIDESKDDISKAMGNYRRDFQERTIIFDSAINSLNDYIPVQYIFVNTDLKMKHGKIAGQVGHAVGIIIEQCINNPDQVFIDWKETLMKKIILKATQEQLDQLRIDYSECVSIFDAGLTQIPSGSLTAIGFRPVYHKDVPMSFSKYKLL